MIKLLLSSFLLFVAAATGFAQSAYRYSVNLNALTGDKLPVTLVNPKLSKNNGIFAFPRIIPGTYNISDYGKFISEVKAFDARGKEIRVQKINDNQWKLKSPQKIRKITYMVEDAFDTEIKHNQYPMAATNFEEKKNYVIHTPGIFGYIDGMSKLPFEISVEKPAGFYGSTAMIPVISSSTTDVFKADNLDDLYDSPVMYSEPDTVSMKVGNCQVLVSVYSPTKTPQAKQIAAGLSSLLNAAKNYLGGKLPADKYAFLFYFRTREMKHSFPAGLGGALEHTTSSFYYLPNTIPPAQIVDIASHEFFHIITPLTIASREIKEFNFNEEVLSEHLWLYEGSTEYTAHHVQVKYGLKTPKEFLDVMASKITRSRKSYNDTLAFTKLSKLAATTYEKQYGNVYEKGALIGACLDLLLLDLSDGNYGFKDLKHDLGVRYGRRKFFNDNELFDVIGELTYPQVKTFLQRYVSGNEPIPYDYYFGLGGIKFTEDATKKAQLTVNPEISARTKFIQDKWLQPVAGY
ncbi:M61 family metallopeptidase [Hufsiella ginkgonis]|uniref:Peptidase M61 n=1 Tax=Hufsiella ginkgonis TaxID=2695274 RepID=A0A7K1Y0L0_9SPHI|nr:peptidase M61 [Hufsiella ginkgonis]MXV16814.1 peptidase M61 [Hufsiella ginkgonis]